MENIFRIELNVLGILVSLIVILMFFKQIKIKNSEDKIFILISFMTLVELVLDSVFWLVDRKAFLYGRQTNLIVNHLYYLIQIVGCYMWTVYCAIHMECKLRKRWKYGLSGVMVFSIALLLANVQNGCIFTVDAENVYRRTWGLWGTLEGVCCLFYPLLSIVITLFKMKNGNEKQRKDGIYLILVSLVPIVSAVIQMLIYGLNFIWVGMSILLLLMFVEVQSKQYQKMENELLEQKIQLMLSQIKPHFLYNSLSAIQVLCMKDQKKASKALEDFSRYLRANMDALGSQGAIPFLQELEHVKHYLNLEQIRFGDVLQVVYDISETDFELPVLTLQPIVENAVKHGICGKEETGTVTIQTMRKEAEYVIRVSDDGFGFDTGILKEVPKKGERSHIGIMNVKNRFESKAGSEHRK